MIGIELDRPCGVLLARAADAGLMISVTADSVVRLLPPLIMTSEEARFRSQPSWCPWSRPSWPSPSHETRPQP